MRKMPLSLLKMFILDLMKVLWDNVLLLVFLSVLAGMLSVVVVAKASEKRSNK